MPKHLAESRNFGFSCGVVQLTGFPMTVNQDVLDDLSNYDGHKNNYTELVRSWSSITNCYITSDTPCETTPCAFVMVSLNQRQARVWRPILLKYNYVEVVTPRRNPNSRSKITIFVRTRVDRRRKKKEAKE